MAGVKGRSGGARPGAGRKPKQKPQESVQAVSGEQTQLQPAAGDQSPLEFLLAVQNNPNVPLKDRIRAAVAAAQYVHVKRADGGKKDEAAEKSKKAASKFSTVAPPKLIVNNR